MKVMIKDRISEKAGGMFRWAYYQLQQLKKLKSMRPKLVKEALYSLPATLDETYEQMLVGIEDVLREDAVTLLRWIAYAKSPPSLSELVDATVIDLIAEGSVNMEDRPGLCDTLEILSGLVTIEAIGEHYNDSHGMADAESKWLTSKDDGIVLAGHRQQIRTDTKVRLAHFSVKEYLESKRILSSNANDFHFESAREHRILAQSCLVYLMHYSSCNKKSSTEEDFATFPLLRYAAQSWFYHAALQQDAEVTREIRLLCSQEALRDWLRVYQPDRKFGGFVSIVDDIGSSLYYASFLGLAAVVDELLSCGSDLNANGGRYGNALQAASFEGHEKVVRMLVDAGADVNAQGGACGNALQAASERGNEKVVKMLIDAGAHVNAQKRPHVDNLSWPSPFKDKYSNALQAASGGGHEKVVQMLVKAAADVNAQGGECSSALYAASAGGHEQVVRVLTDAGANVHARGGRCGNALQAASWGGHKKIVEMLMDAGASVHVQGGLYGNALQAASARGRAQVVQMLLCAGADVNAQGGKYGDALQAASASGEQVVQMLINAGADVNVQRGRFGNALQVASAEGRDKVVQMLLNAGANVHVRGGYYGNALQAALYRCHRRAARGMMDSGAPLNDQRQYDSAIQRALARGYKKVVQMLLDAGADINDRAGYYGDGNWAMSWQGRENVVRMLN